MYRPAVLIFVAYYLPGYKSGGPVRTIANLVEHLGDAFDFRIVALDRDALDTRPYPDVTAGAWNRLGKAQVYYISPAESLNPAGILRLIRKTPHDVLYLNSFFNTRFTVLPLLIRRSGFLPDRPVILAPRGEFSPGALALKLWKKRPYIMLARRLGLYRDIIWQASSEHEAADIRRTMGAPDLNIVIASNPPPLPGRAVQDSAANNGRIPGAPLRVVFLSRITPKKNLDFVLKVLAKVSVPVVFDIYGPVRDQAYWEYCRSLLPEMPSNVTVAYKGSVLPAEVPVIMAAHDLFFFPTRGENYGHVIPEALSAGTPVLIADTTPWRDLEQAGAGWDLPLDKEELFVRCVERCFHLNAEDYRQWREKVKRCAAESLADPELIESNRRLFLGAVNSMRETAQ